MSSLREIIFKTKDYSLKDISIPQWGVDGTFFIRPLSGIERFRFEDIYKNNVPESIVFVIIASLVDKDSKNIFLESDQKEVGSKSGSILDCIFQQALKVSGLLSDSVSEAEKN